MKWMSQILTGLQHCTWDTEVYSTESDRYSRRVKRQQMRVRDNSEFQNQEETTAKDEAEINVWD